MNKQIEVIRYNGDFWKKRFSRESNQISYLQVYLESLCISSVIVEPNYFDKNFSAEYSTFYSLSAKPIPHTCERFLLFSEAFSREDLNLLLQGEPGIIEKAKQSFIGFIVKRPIAHAELGTTVLKWFPDHDSATPRWTNPSREYKLHFVNVEFRIEGIAWQQQDVGISACATVALWSMLQSSAFQEDNFIPTTKDLTVNANLTLPGGARVFPSPGLTVEQICEAIKENMLSPILIEGNERTEAGHRCFTKDVFNNLIGGLIKSGYPILIAGVTITFDEGGNKTIEGGHAVCCVGYRSAESPRGIPGELCFDDQNAKVVYIHDDNFGPSVRFVIEEHKEKDLNDKIVTLRPEAPDREKYGMDHADPLTDIYSFMPTELIIAINQDIFLSPQELIKTGARIGKALSRRFKTACELEGEDSEGFTMSFLYMNSNSYLKEELDLMFVTGPVVGNIRLTLNENCYLSKHLGVIRIGIGDIPMLDLLIDTSNIDDKTNIIASIVFNDVFSDFFKGFTSSLDKTYSFGEIIKGY